MADDDVVASDRPHQRSRDLLEDAVAVLVAELVVDPLEVVEVDDDQRQLAAVATVACELLGQALAEDPVVADPGERVALGEPAVARPRSPPGARGGR